MKLSIPYPRGPIGAGAAFFCVLAFSVLGSMAPAQACLPEQYSRLRTHCVESSASDRLLSILFADGAPPRQIAVIAGVSKYPNLPRDLQLPPAASDVEMLSTAFIEKLMFDEIITLQNDDFTYDNLRYVFENYLPDLLVTNPRSRVVFTFSGHGSDFYDNGFLYLAKTKSISPSKYGDLGDAINLSLLKSLMLPTMKNAQHFLALINACNGGYFLDVRAEFGASALEEKGAHGITAGGAKDAVHASPSVGTGKGSIFFEMFIAAITGREVNVGGRKFENPAKEDGILTTTKLADYLATTISIIENYKLSPRMGALTGRGPGNQGEFFFITDYTLAKATLSNKFPTNAKRVFGISSKESENGLFAAQDLLAGTQLSADMFRTVAQAEEKGPGDNERPARFFDDVSGACLESALKKDERLTWQHLRSDCK